MAGLTGFTKLTPHKTRWAEPSDRMGQDRILNTVRGMEHAGSALGTKRTTGKTNKPNHTYDTD